MRVIKRNGEYEPVSFDKVLRRIQSICKDLPGVDAHNIAQKVCTRIYDGVKTTELDELAAQMCSTLITEHPDYGTLAARIIISNHHKNTSPSFSETISLLWNATDTHGKQNSLISEELYRVVMANKEKLNNVIDYKRDFLFDYFGFKTLERSYLLKVSGRIVERPQHMWMRVALGIHMDDIKAAVETYDLMSRKMFTHATPTLFNAGTPRSQMSSCYLISMEDSISGIYKTLGDCAQISKYSGGIGMHIHAIRARNSHIRGTNGASTGIVPMLRVYNNTARYVNQCFGKDTIVYTREGAKKVEEVRVGDMLVTADGTYKPVLQVARNYVDKDVLEMEVMHCMVPVTVTKEHEIYTVRNVPLCTSYHIVLEDLKKEKYCPQYVSAGELKKGDLMAFPIPSFIQDAEEDADFFRMYGILLGDGHATKKKTCNSVEFGVTLNIDSKERTYAFVCKFLATRGIHFWTYMDAEKSTISVRWTQNQSKLNISYNDLYDNNHQKIVRDAYLHLPDMKTMALLHGLLETDGHADKEIYFFSTSTKLTHAVRYILLRLGILTSGNLKKTVPEPRMMRDGTYIKGNYDMYCVRIPRHPKLRYIYGDRISYSTKLKYFEYDNKLWTRVKDVRVTEYKGYVYDFNMKDNHNYLTEMGLVHNSGKRNGSIAVYLEPWHADIESFIDLRKNHGNEEERCRDLFTAMWINDLFMRRVNSDAEWSLMCPDECPGLSDVFGEDFDRLYEKYEAEGKFRKKVKAQHLWFAILKSQIETGTPYLLYKDSVNKKSNQKHSGVIKSSNLCTEICEISNSKETAVCNLSSVALASFVKKGEDGKPYYDYDGLHAVSQVMTKNLNKVIDRSFYPTPETEYSNRKHRPIGIGVQGLADTYALMRLPFDSPEAAQLNREIFETIYHGAATASMALAKEREELLAELEQHDTHAKRKTAIRKKLHLTEAEKKLDKWRGAYETFAGSPASQGKFQFDLWAEHDSAVIRHSGRWDWETLRKDIMKHGMRNSLLLAPMPTASTSQILGFNEAFEPFTSNIYQRRTLSGEFTVINKHLIQDLIRLGIWNSDMKENLLANSGSVQNIASIPDEIKALYKTVWEIKQKVLIDHSADRGVYVCQSQSLNLFVEDPDIAKLTNMHFYAWKKGLKTGIYYLRTRPKVKTAAFTLKMEKRGGAEHTSSPVKKEVTDEMILACSRANPEACELCSS